MRTRAALLALAALASTACGSDGRAPSTLNVVERDQPGADWSCSSPDDCTADYDAFIELAKSHVGAIPGIFDFFAQHLK